ncbi:tetratricopeptide repeat protein [bacterium]|nr:tetratricopeptide repeat protein [bacterium]
MSRSIFSAIPRLVYSQRLAFLTFLVSIVVVPLYFDFQAYDIYTATKYVAVEALGLALFVFFLLGLTGKETARICITPLGIPVAAYVGSGVISLLFAANPYAGFDRIFFLLTTAAFFLVIPNVIRTKAALQKVIPVILAVAIIVSVIGIMQYFYKSQPMTSLNSVLHALGLQRIEPGLDTYDRETYCSTFGHANFAGQYLVVIVPLVLSMAAWGIGRWRKSWLMAAVLALCAVVSIAFLGITFCRGAWVGTAAAIGVMLLVSPHRKVFLIVGLIAVVVFAAASPFIKDDEGKSVAHKFGTIFDLKDMPTQFRFLVWKSSLRIAKEEPQGAGIGNFQIVYPKYRTVEERRNTGWDKVIHKAHNDYVQTAVELGVLGFAAWIFLILVVLKMAIRTMKLSDDGFLRAASLGLLGGISATFVHSFFSSNLQMPGSAHAFWVTLGLFAAVYGIRTGSFRPCLQTKIVDVFGKVTERSSQDGQKMQSSSSTSGMGLLRILLVVILLAGLTIPIRGLLGNYHFGKGQYFEAMAHGVETAEEYKFNIDKSLEHLRKAVWAQPRAYEVRYFSAIVENIAQNFGIAEVDDKMAVKLAPYFDHIVNHYGTVLYNQAKFSESLLQFNRALELNPLYVDAMIRLGNAYRELGDFEAAMNQYQKAHKIEPENATPLFNRGLIFQHIGEQITKEGGDQAKAREYLTKARDIYESCLKIRDDNIKVLNNLGTVYYSLNDVAKAREFFERAISIIPEHISARVNLASLCESEGDWDCASEQYQALYEISRDRRFLDALERAKKKRAASGPAPGKGLR